MSQNVRQNNLFAAEDFTKIYKSFKNVDFKAYDYDTIQQSMVDYLSAHYPESFNDYIDSDEYIATIQLLAGIASSLAFRVDLNSRENFLDTAERRDSIIRLAKMVNYQPKRNIAASGIFKIVGIQTSEPIQDNYGRSLENYTTFWNDPNNTNSYDQFITIMNAILSPNNPFGKPYKQETIAGIQTSVYRLNSVAGVEVAYPVSISANGEPLSVEVVNVDINDNGVLEEQHPDPANAFSLLYANDGQGLDSENTGFFFYFKQGNMRSQDYRFDFPIQNRVAPINATNINETDVYVQEINDAGDVQAKWKKVPNTNSGNNVIYNAIDIGERNIYSINSGFEDTISIVYPDGNFGEVPTGIFRTWYRTSANKKFIIRPDDASGLSINIPYIGTDGQEYSARFVFSLQYTVSNAAPSETNEQVKVRAPQVYYTQERMVNNEDYNVFPLTRGNEIAKARATNRTHAGHSRYISLNDPTGFHQNLTIAGSDGALFKDNQVPFEVVNLDNDTNESTTIASVNVTSFLKNHFLNNFFYDEFILEYRKYKELNYNATSDTYNKFNVYEFIGTKHTFSPYPDTKIDNTGRFLNTETSVFLDLESDPMAYGSFKFLSVGCKIRFQSNDANGKHLYATVKTIVTSKNVATGIDDTVFTLDINVPKGWYIVEIFPAFRTTLTADEKDIISLQIKNRNNFALRYDVEAIDGAWKVFNLFDQNAEYSLLVPSTNWLAYATYVSGIQNSTNTEQYEFRSRGTRYVFESYREVRFYFDPENDNYDPITQQYERDTITITSDNTIPKQREIWVFDGDVGVWRHYLNTDVFYPSTYIPLKCRDISADDVSVSALVGTGYNFSISMGIVSISATPADGDQVEIIYLRPTDSLGENIDWNIHDNYIQEDGYLDTSKVEIIPADSNEDGVPDEMFSFQNVVATDDIVFFENFVNFDGYTTSRTWFSKWLDVRKDSSPTFTYDDLTSSNMVLTVAANVADTKRQISLFVIQEILDGNIKIAQDMNDIVGLVLFTERRDENGVQIITVNNESAPIMQQLVKNNSVTIQSIIQLSAFTAQQILDVYELDPVTYVLDNNHFIRNGRSFTQNYNSPESYSFSYIWDHVSPDNVRINPSISNILDLIIMTNTYYSDILNWKGKRGSLNDMPVAPTSEELRIQFNELDNYKMMSDQIIYKPAKFKLLFGPQAKPELQAKFKVVKLPNTTLSDNEVKSKIVDAIDAFFDIRNWDFGESFYYTELAAFIHQQLTNIISTVVIVPEYREANFGDLFQIKSEPNELFISTATILDVQIVASLNNSNLRI